MSEPVSNPDESNPDPVIAPSLATWSLRLWFASGALFAVTGAIIAVAAAFAGAAFGIGVGTLSVLIGVGIGVLARRVAQREDPRWRSALAMLTLIATVLGMLLSVLAINPIMLICGLIGLVASMMAYRPEPDAWFSRRTVGDG
ncbi:hypothetical protein [Williamsia sp. CHRR-6]|uniref:hypothetical protein n=1 Tax=Williamsia sp. CHRR-6 TaxID=2835871 RepID=UPI001BDA7575|nr:hypothetical protein [Williamsia sp. CHRR-6]MBT0565975.1 hypothetical protein [Williamsia sp. CHRR-6]